MEVILGWPLKSAEAPYFLPELLLNDLFFRATAGETYFIHQLSKSAPSPRLHFVRNGHALIALLLALGGGFISRSIAAEETAR